MNPSLAVLLRTFSRCRHVLESTFHLCSANAAAPSAALWHFAAAAAAEAWSLLYACLRLLCAPKLPSAALSALQFAARRLTAGLQTTMAACLSQPVACSGALQPHRLQSCPETTRVSPPARPPQPSRRRAVALRAAASSAAAAATSSSGTSPSSFEQLYVGLAGVLAPGGAVAARPTPLGRGLVAEQPVATGDVLLSGKCV